MTAKRRRRAVPSYADSVDVIGGTTDKHRVVGLKPYTSYSIIMTAKNSGGEGPESDQVSASTIEGGMFLTKLLFIINY